MPRTVFAMVGTSAGILLAGICAAGISSSPVAKASPSRALFERSKVNVSAYSPHLSGIHPTISTYERSMSKKTLDTY